MREELHLPVIEPTDAQDSVLQFLAVLAYPQISEKRQRDLFAEAFHAALYKARAWEQRANKHDSAAFRTRVPQQFRRMPNRKIDGMIAKARRRLASRLSAGSMAWCFCWRVLHNVKTPNDIVNEIRFAGLETIRDALRGMVKDRDEHRSGMRYGETPESGKEDAIENFRKTVWLPCMPVLHLATAFYEEVTQHGCFEARTVDPVVYLNLVLNPAWLRDALLRAEGYLCILPARIPSKQFEFDSAKAVRLLPQ